LTLNSGKFTILYRGESASGKSESIKMIVRHLCDLSKTSKKKTKVQSNILKVESVLSAFGNAATPFNSDATCFTKYYELQFNKGKMVGMKLIEYMLEKSRVSGALDGGFTFHVFYYLLAGATHEERTNLHLSDAAHFQYLAVKMRTAGFAQSKGTAQMDALRDVLKSVGIGRRQQTQLWQLLAAVLHIGNINFSESQKTGEACSIKNYPQLQLVADMLGVSPAALQTVLTTRLRHFGRDAIASYLDVESAKAQRDAFARSIYAVIFSWITEQINSKLCAPETDWTNLVALLEVPGIAGVDVQGNSLHRLLINYANERVFAFAMNELFKVSKERLNCAELVFPESPISTEVVEMMAGVKTGIIPIIDSESAKTRNTEKLTAKVYEHHSNDSKFVTASSRKTNRAFAVNHFVGIVEYDTRTFVALDRDTLQSSFVTLVRGSPEESGTSNQFLRSLYSDKLIAAQKSDHDGTGTLN
jgi:chitin synthase